MLYKLRMGLLITMITVLGFVLDVTPSFAANYGYDGKNPVSTHCDDTGVVKATKSFSRSGISGSIKLMYSTKCKTAWAYIKLTKPISSKYNSINGVIHRNNDKKAYSCDSKGGNGHIIKGQTTCYSAMVYDYNPNTSYAEGVYSPGEAMFYSVGKTSSY